jgi:hypothetical protein
MTDMQPTRAATTSGIDIERIHLIFKTHLDLGFTDLARNVVATYFDTFIPQAAALARRTRETDPTRRFRWTVGAWLIYEYLEQADAAARRDLEAAIQAGDITWHALPFTTHSELMDASLFRYGLGYSQKLDQRFSRTTIAAKLTDVPGHTRAIVPLLAGAGIKFLHIGTNPGAAVPDVPPVFVWRDEATRTEVIMMYHHTYGDLTLVPPLKDALAVILTGDNEGPPHEALIQSTYDEIQQKLPHAQVIASTLDDFAHHLLTIRDVLPVVTSEIGDSWIHGVGADPTKIRHYRELSRLRGEWLTRDLTETQHHQVEQFTRHLIMVPEHTWGMDEKIHLANPMHYLGEDLRQMRQNDQTRLFESSWAEQRDYLKSALDVLDESLAQEAVQRLETVKPQRPELNQYTEIQAPYTLISDAFDLRCDAQTGAIDLLLDRRSGITWADESHSLALFGYEVFSGADYDRFYSQYIRDSDEVRRWAVEDYTKVGMPTKEHLIWQPTITQAFRRDEKALLLRLALPEASREFGAPEEIWLEVLLADDAAGIDIRLQWFGKPANRVAEAFWLSFQPANTDPLAWEFEKVGQMISPLDVVSRGGRTLHAVDRGVVNRGAATFALYTQDAPLVAPGKPSLLDFHNELPDMSGGVLVNLYNNTWGTNFPMWFEDDALFRFSLRFSHSPSDSQ